MLGCARFMEATGFKVERTRPAVRGGNPDVVRHVHCNSRAPSRLGARNQGEKTMEHRSIATACAGSALALLFCGSALAADIKGAAILDHPCGKTAVKQMGLVHAGKMDEANKLSTKQMQDQWQKMPAKDREMMSGMMKQMSATEQDFSNDI